MRMPVWSIETYTVWSIETTFPLTSVFSYIIMRLGTRSNFRGCLYRTARSGGTNI